MKNGETTAIIGIYGYDGVKVQLGPWDPNRFPDGKTTYDERGGLQFGNEIDMYFDKVPGTVGFGDSDTYEARISIGGIQAHSPAVAVARAATYVLAADIGLQLEAFTMDGGEFSAIHADAKKSVLLGYLTQIIEDRDIQIYG